MALVPSDDSSYDDKQSERGRGKCKMMNAGYGEELDSNAVLDDLDTLRARIS
jgi:hypothetical protein